MITWVTISLQVIAVDFETATGTHLQVAGLVDLKRESTSVGVTTFLVNMEC
jgi:hypothetical protein